MKRESWPQPLWWYQEIDLSGDALRHTCWLMARKEVVERRGEAELVAALVGGAATELLERRVLYRTDTAGAGNGLFTAALDQPEVYQHDPAIWSDADIGWFDIAVDDRWSMAVKVCEHLADLESIGEHLCLGEETVPGREHILKALAGDQFHHQMAVAIDD